MKIFLSFLQAQQRHNIPAYDFWEGYIKNGITEAGYEWVECPTVDWAEGLVPQSQMEHNLWKENAWSKTLSYLKNNPADIFLSYLYPHQIDETAIREIKKTGIPCINFFCDNVRLFKSAPSQFKVFDCNWVPEYKAIDLYKKVKYPFINLPMPMWVAPRYRTLQDEDVNQITFIGSADLQRKLLFEEVLRLDPDIPLSIYGNGWLDDSQQTVVPADYTFGKKLLHQYDFIKQNGLTAYGRKISQRTASTSLNFALKNKLSGTLNFDDYNRLTAQSNITLGVNRYPSFNYPLHKPNSYSRLRDIEAPMLGACYLTEWTEGIDQLYDLGTEIETYKTAAELVDKAKYLQANKQKRQSLKLNAQKRALNDHSIKASLQKLIEYLH